MHNKIPDFTDIYQASLFGAAKQFEYFFDTEPTRVVSVANNWHMREMVKKYKEMEYPYFAVQRTAVAVQDGGLAAKNTRRTGIRGGRTSGFYDSYVYNIFPVQVTLRVLFVCQTEADRMAFEQQWMYIAVGGDLKFYLDTTDSSFKAPINMVMDKNLTLPDFENDDIGEQFTIETSVQLNTYLGKIKVIKAVVTPAGTFETQNANGDFVTDTPLNLKKGTTTNKAKPDVEYL